MPVATNMALLVFHALSAAWLLFLLPLYFLPLDAAWGLSLIPLILSNNPLWSLTHETIHGSFHPNPSINRIAGRFLAICYGAPWRVVRTGHLLHHRFNRTLDRPDVAASGRTAALAGYYFQLLFGLYLTQLLSMLAFFPPLTLLLRARDKFVDRDSYNGHAARQLLAPGPVWEIRIDSILIIALICLSAVFYGDQVWLLALFYAARAFCISFLDYIYHYASPLGDPDHAFNLRMPALLQAFLLNFNLHAVHHRHPQTCWHRLPEQFARDNDGFAGGYFSFALRQLRGPVPEETLSNA